MELEYWSNFRADVNEDWSRMHARLWRTNGETGLGSGTACVHDPGHSRSASGPQSSASENRCDQTNHVRRTLAH